MKRRLVKRILLTLLLSSSWQLLLAQSIENVQAAFTGERVLVTYDLIGSADETYNIQIFGSHNNFSAPIRLVTGDVGPNVKAGKAKTIQWSIVEELVNFKGQITFRVRGEVVVPPLSIQSPGANATVKNGKTTEVKWTGGRKTANVKIELLQNGAVTNSITDAANTGSYSWVVPKDLAKGTYSLRLSSGTESATAGPVIVKAPLPLWAKLAPIAVAGVVAVVILLDKPIVPPPSTDLPDAPRPK